MLIYNSVDALLVLCLKSHDNGTILKPKWSLNPAISRMLLKLCDPQVPEQWDAPEAKAALE